MFSKKNDNNYKIALDGINYKTIAWGKKTSLCKFKLSKGKIIPIHKHIHEQTGYLISGKLNFLIGEQRINAEAGDGWSIPGNIAHGVEVLEDSVVIEVFSPLREEYLP